MHAALEYILHSETAMALLIAVLIFLMTLLLVVKRWIGFSITFLLLVFALAAGVVINNQEAFQKYLENRGKNQGAIDCTQDAFHKQMIQAVEDLKAEVKTEKENLTKVAEQVQEIFNHMDVQKQKLQSFIEETRDRFKTEHPTSPAPDSDH